MWFPEHYQELFLSAQPVTPDDFHYSLHQQTRTVDSLFVEGCGQTMRDINVIQGIELCSCMQRMTSSLLGHLACPIVVKIEEQVYCRYVSKLSYIQTKKYYSLVMGMLH